MNNKSAAVMNWRNRTKLRLIEYKGGKCARCGYNKSIPHCYDFHHQNPKEKEFGIGGKSFSYEKLKKEVDKCILLCKICHAELHWEECQKNRIDRMEKLPHVPRLQNKICICEKSFKPKTSKQKFCSPLCSHNSTRKVERPCAELLAKEINENTWTDLGKRYGVSDNAVKKWAKSYGLIN